MVYDNLDRLARYSFLNENICTVIKYLKERSTEELLALPAGRYDIDGENCRLFKQSFDSKPIDEKGFELHTKYTDLQIVLGGIETCYIDFVNDQNAYPGYDEEADLCLYPHQVDGRIILYPGVFALLEPNDGHLPQRRYGDTPVHVEKLLFKLRNAPA